MSYENILYEVEDGILTITLNRPEMLNAFNGGMMADLMQAFDNADADDDVHAIIITGAGRGRPSLSGFPARIIDHPVPTSPIFKQKW